MAGGHRDTDCVGHPAVASGMSCASNSNAKTAQLCNDSLSRCLRPALRLGIAAHRGETRAKEPEMRVPPYHSTNATDPDVHHTHDNCPSGQQIPAYNKRPGTNTWPLCKHCASM